MEEYVAKSTLKKELNIANLHSGIVDALQNIVEEIPAADVQEVKHGKWMDGKYFPFIPKKGTQGFQTATCSRCNITQSVNTYQEKVMFNYCPYCGAKMGGKENDE